MKADQIISSLKEHWGELKERGVKSIAIFGSMARGEATPESDVDILIEFDKPIGLFEFVRVKFYLEEIIGSEVDLVTPEAIRPAMREQILAEAIYAE
jgi:predicted nucleotidyltransferase